MQTCSNILKTCEACRKRPCIEYLEDDDTSNPYLVCAECSERLKIHALRPIEWFNLAAKHGWQKFLLHDDFYDQDGTARQPDTHDYTAAGMEAPSLLEAALSLERLIDYCTTRWHLSEDEFDALRSFPPEDVLAELKVRAAVGNVHILEVALKICANVLGARAASWVDAQYDRSCESSILFSWAEAAAGCLPEQEGLRKSTEALAPYRGQELRVRKDALLWFRSPLVLDWIEQNVPHADVTSDWGQLAALSKLSWGRAEAWFAKGRPFSLIALDALDQFIPRPGHELIIRELQPVLLQSPDRLTIMRVLQSQMGNDPAPRSVRMCKYLIEKIAEVRTSDQT